MVEISLLILVAKPLLEALARLSPLLPIPLVLALERWAASRLEFSWVGELLFRVVYLACALLAVFATYFLGLLSWN